MSVIEVDRIDGLFDSLTREDHKLIWKGFEKDYPKPNPVLEPSKSGNYQKFKQIFCFASLNLEPGSGVSNDVFQIIVDAVSRHPEANAFGLPKDEIPITFEEISKELDLDNPKGKWTLIRDALVLMGAENKLIQNHALSAF